MSIPLNISAFYKYCLGVIITLLWCSVSSVVSGQKFTITPYGEEFGLFEGKVHALSEDRLGNVWVAVDEGLVRYDGIHFTLFALDELGSVPKTLIRTDNGKLLALGDFGLMEIEADNGQLKVKELLGGTMEVTDSTLRKPSCIYEDSSGNLWIGEGSTVVKYKNGGLIRYKVPSITGGKGKMDIVEDGYHNVWLMLEEEGLFRFDTGLESFEKATFNNAEYVTYMGDNKFWVGDEGIWEIRVNSIGSVVSSKLISDSKVKVISFIRVSDKSIYLGTETKGILHARRRKEQWEFLPVYFMEHQKIQVLPFESVYHMFRSANGGYGLWVSTEDGIYLIEPTFFQSIPELPFYATYALSQSKMGKVLVCMGELFQLEEGEEDYSLKEASEVSSGFVSSVVADGKGYWYGDVKGNLKYVEEDRVKAYFDLSENGGSIFFINTDMRGNLWVCQAPKAIPFFGLIKINPKSKLEYYESEKGLDNRVLVVRQGRDGQLYCGGIGEGTYLYRYDPEKDIFVNLSRELGFVHNKNFEVHDIAIDRTGTVWMASTDGLIRQDKNGVERVDLGEETTDEIRALAMGDGGALWIATATKGLIYYKNDKYVFFTTRSGLPSNIMAYRSLMIDRERFLWVGTSQGVVRSSVPNSEPGATPAPVIQSLMVNGVKRGLTGDDLSIKYGSSLDIAFKSPAFPSEDITYQTRLIGLQDRWSPVSKALRFSISKIPDGKYVFQVRAKQAGGYKWSDCTQYTFIVDVVWYRTKLAYGIYLALLSWVIWVFIAYKSKKLKDKNTRLEAAVRQRTEEINAQKESLKEQNEIIHRKKVRLEAAKKTIEIKNEELQKANLLLEKKVKERTGELENTFEKLLVVNRELDQFIYRSAHDIRGPISTLLGLCSLAMMEISDEKALFYLHKIESSGLEMNHLLTQMIKVHEIKGLGEVTLLHTNLRYVVEDVIHKLTLGENGMDIDVEIDIDKSVFVKTEPGLLSIMLQSLISNAIQFKDGGKSSPYVRISTETVGTDKVTLIIEDNGIGIPDGISSKVFDMFFRGSELSIGRGLGLYIVVISAQKINAKVTFQSKEKVGTTFSISLNAGTGTAS